MLFGSINSPSGGAKPGSVQMNGMTGEVQFFLGDHWIHVGQAYLVVTPRGMYPQLPDLNRFLESRRHLDDGSDIWMDWGPTVN